MQPPAKYTVPAEKIPFWGTKQFRLLILVLVMSLSVMAVIVFEIAPALAARHVRDVKKVQSAGLNAFVPQDPAAWKGPSEVKYDGVLDPVKDSTPVDRETLEKDEPYGYMVRYLSSVKPDVLSKQAKVVDYVNYSRVPEQLRGETVHITALFAWWSGSPQKLTLRTGEEKWVSRVYLVDLSATEGYVVDLLEPPPAIPHKALVACDAVFIKLGTYEGSNGVVQAPLLLGRNLRIVKEAPAALDPMNPGIMVGSVAAVSVALAIFLTRKIWQRERTVAAVPRPVPVPKGELKA